MRFPAPGCWRLQGKSKPRHHFTARPGPGLCTPSLFAVTPGGDAPGCTCTYNRQRPHGPSPRHSHDRSRCFRSLPRVPVPLGTPSRLLHSWPPLYRRGNLATDPHAAQVSPIDSTGTSRPDLPYSGKERIPASSCLCGPARRKSVSPDTGMKPLRTLVMPSCGRSVRTDLLWQLRKANPCN